MSDLWLELMSDVLPDAIKILGPAFFTALVAIYTIRKQSSTSLKTQKMQLRLQARKQVFEFYQSEMLRAEENADKAVQACAQLVGMVVAEDATETDYPSLSRELTNFLTGSSAVVPITSRKIIRELSEQTDDYAEFLDLLTQKTKILESFSVPIPRTSYKEYAIVLADVLNLQGQCYSALMQINAIDSMHDNELMT